MIASTVSIPAQESSDGDGGEWELLVGKVKDWLEQNDLAELWTKAKLPLRVVGSLIVFSLVATVPAIPTIGSFRRTCATRCRAPTWSTR